MLSQPAGVMQITDFEISVPGNVPQFDAVIPIPALAF
jgi:hypothetical protein